MILFVGEAPGEDEIEPLTGTGGRVFARLLRMAGLARIGEPPAGWREDVRRAGLRQMLWERADHALTNVFGFVLPGGDLGSVFASAKVAQEAGFADPNWQMPGQGYLRPERRWVMDVLKDECVRGDPVVVVPLGAVALWAFTGSAAIMESRGTVLRASRIMPGVKLVPTLDPEWVQADWRFLAVVAADLVRARIEHDAGPDHIVHRGARELWIEPTLEDLDLWWRERGAGSRLMSVDIETARGQITCVGLGADAVSALCVPFVDWRRGDRNYWAAPGDELAAWAWLERALASPVPKVLQNGPFDVAYLLGRYGLRIGGYRHDTRLMHHALYPELPKSLAFMGACYGKPPGAWKTMRTAAKGDEKRDA